MGYVNRELLEVPKAKWSKLMSDDLYRVGMEYENNRFRATAQWHGVVKYLSSSPKEHWKPFECHVETKVNTEHRDDDGNVTEATAWVTDPVMTAHYHSMEDAIQAYCDFLTTYTECRWIDPDTGESHETHAEGLEWSEVGNKLTPVVEEEPEPPSPDAPSTTESNTLEAGVW